MHVDKHLNNCIHRYTHKADTHTHLVLSLSVPTRKEKKRKEKNRCGLFLDSGCCKKAHQKGFIPRRRAYNSAATKKKGHKL